MKRFLLLFILTMFLSPLVFATASFVQSPAPNAFASATSFSQAYGSSNTSGNLLVVVFDFVGVVSTPTISDSQGNTWTAGPASNYGSDGLMVWYAPNCKSGANTVTVALNASSNTGSIIIAEYSGVDTLDQSGIAFGTNGTLVSPDKTTTVANELLIGFYGSTAGGLASIAVGTGGGGTNVRHTLSTAFSLADNIVTSTGTYHANCTNVATTWAIGIITFYKTTSGNSISGSVGVPGVTVSYTGTASGSSTSDGAGNYTLSGLGAGSYTVTPSLASYTFSPTSANETISGSNITGVNFTPTFGGFNVWANQGTAIPAVGADAPEQPNVLYESGAQILSPNIDGKIFKMWFTTGAVGSPVGINYAESNDGLVWTRYSGNPVIASRWGSRVFKNGSTYYLYCSNNVFGTAIHAYTSSDGLSWTLANANAIVTSGSGWDSVAVGQLSILGVISGTWYGYYWGISTTNPSTVQYYPGLATSSDGVTWTKGGSNPIASLQNGAMLNGQTWNMAAALFFTTVNGVYYAWSQVAPTQYPGGTNQLPSDLMRFQAFSPSGPWTSLGVLTYSRTLSSEGVGTDIGQCADPAIVSALGNLYLYYSADPDGNNGDNYVINVATASSTTMTQLVSSYEGNQNIPISGAPQLNLNTTTSDNFNRSNVNPIGGNWTVLSTGAGFAAAQLSSNAVFGTVAGDDSDSYWNAITWPTNQWSQVTVPVSSASSYVGVDVRMSTSNVVTAYRMYWNGNLGSTGTWQIQRVLSGSYIPIGGSNSLLTLTAGDKLLAVAVGSQISFYWNGLLLTTVSDSNITSGAAGFLVVPVTSASNASIDNWSGGTFTNAPSVTPSASQIGLFLVGP